MVTSEGLSRAEVELNNEDEDPDGLSKLACLHLGLADVKDAFHRFKISKLYRSFFALPEVRGEEVGAPLVGMGHTWSLFSVRKRLKRRCGPLQTFRGQKFSRITVVVSYHVHLKRRSVPHCDRSPRTFFYVYVDNLGVLGTSRENVDNDLMMAIQTLKSRGLDTHEETVHSDTAIALVIHIDLRNMLVSAASTRLWRLKQGLRWALRCRALPGKTWEALPGHMTYVSLLRRDVLSVPFALNKFIRANYETSTRVWPSARAEVQAFVGLLPSISSSWTRDWCSCIVATDASEYGFGVSAGVRKSRLSDHRTDQ